MTIDCRDFLQVPAGGVAQFVLAATDSALWDILGQYAGLPVCKMLGAYRDRIPVYSMCGWYYDADDERRIRVAQDTMGTGMRRMVDANQVFDRWESLLRGKAYQAMDVFWLEEPLPSEDTEGFALVTQALDMHTATGANLNSKYALADLIARRGANIVHPDNRRAGGVCERMENCAIAAGYKVDVSSHGRDSTNLNMLLDIPNATYLKSGDRRKMADGEVLMRDEPGMSSEVSSEEFWKYKVG